MIIFPNLVLTLLTGLWQVAPLEISVATVPAGSRVNLALVPLGEAELRGEASLTRVRIRIDRVDPLTDLGRDFRAWVVWAVSPEGEFENLGELQPDGRGARLETVTSAARFGILITSEPHFRVDTPASTVAFRSGESRRDDTRLGWMRVEVGRDDYDGINLPPQGGIHPRVTQARMAVAIASQAEASRNISSPRLREARAALDSVEQLLRRDTPLDVVLAYADDAIRLADLASREAAAEEYEARLRQAIERAVQLEASLELARRDFEGARQRESEALGRVNELLVELEQVRSAWRTLTIERDTVARDLRGAEEEIQRLQDPWPPLIRALAYGFGARETPRGMILILPASDFPPAGLEPETREWLSRLAGTLGFGEVPEIWIEGHSRLSQAEDVSEERATRVREALVAAGLPEALVHARGLGGSSPIPGTDAEEDPELHERVEIIVREFGAL
jgi:flagellar motor protein MotB